MSNKTVTKTETTPTKELDNKSSIKENNLNWVNMVFGICTTIIGLTFPPLIFLYGNFGFFLGVGLSTLFLFIDMFISTATMINYNSAKLNGFPDSKLFPIIFMNWVSSYIPFYVIVVFCCGPYDPSLIHFDFKMVYQFAIAFVVNDVGFYFCHKFLHNHLPETHKLHHTCKHPSYTTNLFFDPLDLSIELGAPMILTTLTYVLFFNDPFGLVCALGIFFAWYGLDHDEYFKMPHWYHHKYVHAIYPIYTSFKMLDENENVKKLLK